MTKTKMIICSEYLKERLYHRISETNGTGSAAGIDLRSAGVLLRFQSEEDRYASFLVFSRKANQNRDSFPVYGRMVQFPAFIQEILSFARECALYGIRAEDLPAETESEKELAGLLGLALAMPLEEHEIYRNYEKTLSETVRKEPEFTIPFETDIFRKRFLDDLKERLSEVRVHGDTAEAEDESLRFSLSTRQEIEAAAQEICLREKPCNVILCDMASQLPVLEQVFRRYGIPCSIVQEQIYAHAFVIYLALARFALEKDRDSFLQALRTNAFSLETDPDLIPFAERVLEDPFLEEDISSRITIEDFSQEAGKTKILEERLRDYLDSVKEETSLLLSAQQPANALVYAYRLLQNHPLINDPVQLEAGTAIRAVLSQTVPLIETEEDAQAVLSIIENLRVNARDMDSDFCTVTDLRHPVDASDTSYILGCSGRNFPGIPSRKGIFDEAYVSGIEKYPSLQERHDSYMEQLDWIYHSGKHLVWSYATNDYQGRNIEPAFEVTGRLDANGVKSVPWKPGTLPPVRETVHRLEPETAGALFVGNDGKIYGSISRFERWFQCPYSYFIESGLKIRKFDTPGLDSATIGTIQHAFMENMIKTYGKDYVSVTKQEIIAFLTPWFEELKTMRPLEAWQIDLTKERMAEGLLRSLLFLSEAEKNTIYKPEDQEKQFDYDVIPGIHLRGIIDRIDTSSGMFRVIDYKSSTHKLSETSVKAGIQLQLLSYVFAAETILNQTPSGAVYFSMQSKASGIDAAAFKTKGIVLEEDVRDETRLKELSDQERKFTGWSFAGNETDDAFKQYFSMPLYDLERTRQCIKELYEYFRDHLLDGEIQADPLDSACMFCLNAATCRNTKGTRKAEPVVMADVKLKPGKEDAS